MSYIYIHISYIYIYTRSYILLLIHTVYIILICIFVCGLTYLYIYICMYIYIYVNIAHAVVIFTFAILRCSKVLRWLAVATTAQCPNLQGALGATTWPLRIWPLPLGEGKGDIAAADWLRGHRSEDLGWEGGLPWTSCLGSPTARSIIYYIYCVYCIYIYYTEIRLCGVSMYICLWLHTFVLF